DAAGDPRFASCLLLPPELPDAEIVAAAVGLARKTGAAAVITFAEVDIVIAGLANEQLGVPWARSEADRICRDKARQREFLRAHDIPSVWYHGVSDIEQAMDVARERGLPLIVKPTKAASSSHVELVNDLDRLAGALADIERLARGRSRHYYEEMPE